MLLVTPVVGVTVIAIGLPASPASTSTSTTATVSGAPSTISLQIRRQTVKRQTTSLT